MRRTSVYSNLLLLSSLLFLGCGGPDDRKLKFYQKGKILYARGEYLKARLELKNAVQIDQKFAEAQYLLGMVELKRGKLTAAYAAFAKACEIKPSDLEAQVELGKLLLLKGAPEKALEKALLVLKLRPQHEEASLLQGALWLGSGAPAKTVRSMTEMLSRGTTRPDVYLLLALARRLAEDDAGAEKALLEGVSHNGASLPLHRALADLYAGQGKHQLAAAEITRMIELEPANHSYEITLADLSWRTHDQARARAGLNALLLANPNDEKLISEAAAFYVLHGQIREAEQVLHQGISVNRESVRLPLALSDLYVSSDRSEKAVALLKRCVALQNGKSKQLATKNALAVVQLERGELAEAGRLADEVLRESAGNRDANLIKGRLALLRGDAPKAVAAFRRVVQDRAEDVEGYFLLADAYLLNRDTDRALETLQQAEKLDPKDVEVQLALARYHTLKHDYRAAERELRVALLENTQDPQLLAALGDLFFAARDQRQAQNYYEATKATAAGAIIGRVKLSELFALEGKTEQAAEQLSQAIEMAPDSDELFGRLIQLYLRLGKYSEAADHCRERIAAAPKRAATHLLLGRVLGEQGEFARAEASFKQAEKVGGPSVQLSLARAALQWRAGDPKRAREVMERTTAEHPYSIEAANDFACLLADCGNGGSDLQKALKLAEQVNLRRPGDPLLMDTLGWVHYRMGQYQKAAQLLQRAAAQLPHTAVVRYHAGMALYRAGQRVLAHEHLQNAVISPVAFAGKKEAQDTLRTSR
jgi:tetratricopeptide (TPR) repeat protein